MREAHEEEPRSSVVVFEADSASIWASSSIDGERKRKRCEAPNHSFHALYSY
jgi:hypothetical protein